MVHHPPEVETVGSALVKAAHQLGITALHTCQVGRLFFLQGQITLVEAHRLAAELLADPVTEAFSVIEQKSKEAGQQGGPLTAHRTGKEAEGQDVNAPQPPDFPIPQHIIEVTLLPGVTDPAAENLVRAAHLLGLTGLNQAATGYRYTLTGSLTETDVQRMSVELFSNPVIQQIALNQSIAPPFISYQQADETVDVIPLHEAGDDELLEISADRRLALNLAEMQTIQVYYQQEGRDPTDVELEMLAQTWSEHCIHKSFKAIISYAGPRPGAPPDSQSIPQTINGLLKTYIRAATERVAKPWLIWLSWPVGCTFSARLF